MKKKANDERIDLKKLARSLPAGDADAVVHLVRTVVKSATPFKAVRSCFMDKAEFERGLGIAALAYIACANEDRRK